MNIRNLNFSRATHSDSCPCSMMAARLFQTPMRSSFISPRSSERPTGCRRIRKALPQAKMMCLLRDPMDSTFSNLKELFAGDHYPYSYDALETAAHVVRFREMLAHWNTVMPGAVLVVRYEELVREPERVMRGVLEHCGLPFEPACADLARNAAPSATASSSQVRQPLHTRSIGAWRRYAKPLAAAESFLRERLPAGEFASEVH